MIDSKTVLDDDILLAYLLEEISAKECEVIEERLSSNPEVKARYDLLETDFEMLGLENTITPPANIKSALLQGIQSPRGIINLSEENVKHRNKLKNLLGIAATVASLFLVSSFWMSQQLNIVKNQLESVKDNNTTLRESIAVLDKQLNDKKLAYATIIDPDTEQYVLKGNHLLPDAKVISYVNHTLNAVIINTQRLPKTDTKHDYQMWADVAGEMIDMGVIPKEKTLTSMRYIEDTESINITIEPEGGSQHPSVERLVSNVFLK